jgi:Tfp pilus assembly protein PilF
MGLAYRAKGDTVQAKAHWQQALKLDPNNRNAQQLLSGRGGRGGRGQ